MTHADALRAVSPFAIVVVAAGALLAMSSAYADTLSDEGAIFAWDDLGARLKASQEVSALGPDLMGDRISLSNGALSFVVTDVSLPGNSAIPVELIRRLEIKDRKGVAMDGMLADWQIEAPNISGVFAPDWVGTGSHPGGRCTAATLPVVHVPYKHDDFWEGLTLNIPDGGEVLRRNPASPAPTDGNVYPWNTASQIQIGCLTSIKNGTGDGFFARTPDGLTYYFDWMARNDEKKIRPAPLYTTSNPQPTVSTLDRKRNALYATRVEDRFGNRVEYTYTNAWNEPARLTRIAGTDGRLLTIAYAGQYISTVDAGSRRWTYTVDPASKSLRGVTLPDGSRWELQLAEFAQAFIESPVPQYSSLPPHPHDIPSGQVILPDDVFRSCAETFSGPAIGSLSSPVDHLTGTIIHPSGAVGVFKIDLQEHGRSHVPLSCKNVTTVGSTPPYWGYGNDPSDDVPLFPISAFTFTLRSKTLSGPGMPSANWTYSYAPNISYYRYPGTTEEYPVCPYGSFTECAAPPCTSDACARSSITTVNEPDGRWRRFFHGNTYRYNEGKLLREEIGSGTSIARAVTYTYDLTQTDGSYIATFGSSLRLNGDGFQSEYHRPLRTRTITQEGVDFVRENASFDAFARPILEKRYNSLGYTRSEAVSYFDNTSRWVLGQLARRTCMAPADCAGQIMVEVEYEHDRALPTRTWRFNALEQYIDHHADGTISRIADGRTSASFSTASQLNDWKFGHPQQIVHPDGTLQRSVVDGNGWITSKTDENGVTTQYGYDAMGRVNQVIHPAGDSVAWAPTTIEFRALTAADGRPPGIAPGQWRRMASEGARREITYFDAMWRPVLTHEYDDANMVGTLRATLKDYDASGRLVFQSYPSQDLIPDALGIWTTYDVLDRARIQRSDSELGPLTTVTDYLPGIQKRVVDPRGIITLTSFDAYDEPRYDLPVSMDMAEGIHTEIDRDVYGKPVSISRGGAQ